jgi:hypothetical protein
MVSSEVQRTLVKSPPELWAELSDPAALARHLGELGKIRIVKTKPEERVEWEADSATGMVLIKASGWGTKVTLSVTKEIEAAAVERPALEEPQIEPSPAEARDVVPALAAEQNTEIDPSEAVAELTPQRPLGFFSRLFRRRRSKPSNELARASATPVPVPAPETLPPRAAAEPTEPTTVESADLAAAVPAELPTDMSAELAAAEEAATERVTAVLTEVLDRLGAAHHRPFSRA